MRREHNGFNGFTLVELMVVIVIIGLLAAIAAPRFTAHLIQGHLEAAKPYLMEIAAKEKIRFNEYGTYYTSSNSSNSQEKDLKNTLGVDLQDAGDFCFMTVCKNNCSTTSSANFLGDDDATADDFEVWAILRKEKENTNTTNVDTDGGDNIQCTTDDTKNSGTGWVDDTNEGRIVVLHYPPPKNGMDSDERDWVDGISISNVFK